jgi:epoxide hydrolase 4
MRASPPLRASPIGLPTDIALHPTLDGPWTHRFAQVGTVRLHYVEAGEGPLVILLHGFPDFWIAWRRQIPFLAQSGFRVVAPDLRGFNLSDKPRGVENYTLDVVADEIAALVKHLKVKRAHIVGHDIGGAVAWKLASRRPEVVEKLVAVNAPPSRIFRRALRHPSQLRRSWYMFFFALPWLPERIVGARRAAMIGRVYQKAAVRPGAFEPEEIDAQRDAASRPGALRAMLNYYRAMFRGGIGAIGTLAAARAEAGGSRTTVAKSGKLNRPALVIWSDQDPFLDLSLVNDLSEWGTDVRLHRVSRAGHWPMADAPTDFNRALKEFLTR